MLYVLYVCDLRECLRVIKVFEDLWDDYVVSFQYMGFYSYLSFILCYDDICGCGIG